MLASSGIYIKVPLNPLLNALVVSERVTKLSLKVMEVPSYSLKSLTNPTLMYMRKSLVLHCIILKPLIDG